MTEKSTPDQPGEAPDAEGMTFGEWVKTPKAQAQFIADLRARMQPGYEPTPLERAMQELVREYVRLHRINVAAGPVLGNYLAQAGWFLGGRFLSAEVGILADLVRNSDLAGAEAMMITYARGEVDHVEELLAQHWPDRTAILSQAFAAHREERYALSVPVFLAQADGIADEVLGVSLYNRDRKDRGQPGTRRAYRDRLEGASDPERHPWTMIFGPLEVLCSWRESVDDWREGRASEPHYGGLNRHGVLHGLDLEYPTEGNSLRAILLLQYVAGIGAWLDRRVGG
jgi:hypothetical protein